MRTRPTRYRVAKGFFGSAGSPLVEDGRVIANVGGKGAGIVAFDAATGKVLWTATDDEASYSSPVGATIGGRRLAVFLTRSDAARAGSRHWRHRVPPAVAGAQRQLGECGDARGGRRSDLRLGRVRAWRRSAARGRLEPRGCLDGLDSLTNHYATSVHSNGILYGYHGRQEFGPALRAVELRTGKVRWTQEQFRAGSIILAGHAAA